MACFGSKALQPRRGKAHNLTDNIQMAGEENPWKHQGKKKNRRPRKEFVGFGANRPTESSSARYPDKIVKARKSLMDQNASVSQASILRKQVDPETAKYFSEIANLFEGTGVDLEERSIICGNALEETKGKELELATDYVISHTLETLLEGCDLDHICGFFRSCANEFPFIAMDRSGSHVAETALRSLAARLQDEEAYSVIEDTLARICQVIEINPVNIMCNIYGSHVLRSLLCLCKGVPLDSLEEFHVTKSSTRLVEWLNLRSSQSSGKFSSRLQLGFPDLFKLLVSAMFKCAREDVTLQIDTYSGLVLQTALKLSVGDDQDLLHLIPFLVCHCEVNLAEGSFIDITMAEDIVELLKETGYSHLMEVILEVAPEMMYNEIFTKVFRNSLFEISSHCCGSFVVQALVSHAKSQKQMDLIWKELGPKFKDLLEMGRSGVIASFIAASQRLQTHEHESCQALAAAVCSENVSPHCIVPRILFMESYFCCEDKSNWKWPKGEKMHVLGCLILQAIYRYKTEFIQPYVTSIISMETDNVIEMAKDAGGGRVVEAFLNSYASTKHKRKLIMKLRNHFGELSMHPSGSFTVEKCFNNCNLSLRETIASELLAVRAEISRTKQGPLLLRKIDVDGFEKWPDQWRSRQASKQSAYKEFYSAFGSTETTSRSESFLSDSFHCSSGQKGKKMKKGNDKCVTSVSASLGSQFGGYEASLGKLGFSSLKRCSETANWGGEKFSSNVMEDDALKRKQKEQKKSKFGVTEKAVLVSEATENPPTKKKKRGRRFSAKTTSKRLKR